MKPIARQGDLHRCPCSGHGVTPIVSGSPQSRVEGQPVARVGDKTACGATIIEGSGSATTDGQPTAYLGCKTDHGGEIISDGAMKVIKLVWEAGPKQRWSWSSPKPMKRLRTG